MSLYRNFSCTKYCTILTFTLPKLRPFAQKRIRKSFTLGRVRKKKRTQIRLSTDEPTVELFVSETGYF